jgi:hypothetical protein
VSEKYAPNHTADDLCSALCNDLSTSAIVCNRHGKGEIEKYALYGTFGISTSAIVCNRHGEGENEKYALYGTAGISTSAIACNRHGEREIDIYVPPRARSDSDTHDSVSTVWSSAEYEWTGVTSKIDTGISTAEYQLTGVRSNTDTSASSVQHKLDRVTINIRNRM